LFSTSVNSGNTRSVSSSRDSVDDIIPDTWGNYTEKISIKSQLLKQSLLMAITMTNQMALSRVYTTIKAANIAKLLLLNKHWV